jgi:hypothetical protein
MCKRWLLCVLLGTLAWAQAVPGTPGPPQTEAPPADPSAAVPPTAAVITIKGVCPAQAKTAAKGTAVTGAKTAAANVSADCKTVITKAEFETLASHLAPNVTPQMKKQLASVLPQWILMSNEAKKKGLDKTPQFEDRVKVLKMQILSQELRQNIQDEAGKISPEETEKYYKEHANDYEQFNLDRLFVPRTKQIEPEAKGENEKPEKLSDEAQKAKQAEQKAKADEAEQAMTQLAESLRARAAAGEDFAKLQKEAFAAAGMKMDSPTVNLPSVRRTGLPPAQSSVLDLKPGEVSQVINDAGGHSIYKLNSKSEIPLDQVKNEIHSKLQNDRMREMMEKLSNPSQIETNEAYFGAGGVGPAPGPRPSRLAPPTAPRAQPQTAPPAQPPAATPN